MYNLELPEDTNNTYNQMFAIESKYVHGIYCYKIAEQYPGPETNNVCFF